MERHEKNGVIINIIVVSHTIYFLLANFPWLSPLANIRPNTKTVNGIPIAISSPPFS